MISESERILITGASGFIGGALLCHLAPSGVPVAALSRHPAPALSDNVTPIQADLCDMAALQKQVHDFAPTLCFHLAAAPDAAESHGQSVTVIDSNVTGTLNLLEALRLSGPCRVVYGCSVKVYGNGPVPNTPDQASEPNSSYAVSKAAGWSLMELYHRLYDMPVAALRPTLVFGPGQGMNIVSFIAGQIAQGKTSVDLMGGNQTRAPLYIDDTVAAFCALGHALAENPDLSGTALPIGGDEEVQIIDLVERMIRIADSPLKAAVVDRATRPTEIFRSATDNSFAANLIGWRPAWSLEQGLEETLRQMGVLPEVGAAGQSTLSEERR